MTIGKKRGQVTPEAADEVIARSGGRCEAELPKEVDGKWYVVRCGRAGEQIHHKKFRSRLGSGANPKNLSHLCAGCHERAGDNADAWFARYRTRSHQEEGRTELDLWNRVSNLVKSMPGIDALINGLVAIKRPIAHTICEKCGLVDFACRHEGMGIPISQCRGCGEVVTWEDVTVEAACYRDQMRI